MRQRASRRATATSSNILRIALVAIHVVLGAWAAVGLIEWALGSVPWTALSNPDLPRGLLLVHWIAMLGTATAVVAAVVRRAPDAPRVMALGYASLAAICAVETFFFLRNEDRFVSMAIEYATYAFLLALSSFTPRASLEAHEP